MIWMREISSVSSDWSEPRCLRAGALQREDSCRRSFGVREVWDGVGRLVRCRPNGRLPINHDVEGEPQGCVAAPSDSPQS